MRLERAEYLSIFGIVMMIAVLVSGTYVLELRAVDKLVLKESEMIAVAWVDHVSRRPGAREAMISGESIPKAVIDEIDHLSDLAGITAAHVYREDGSLNFTEGRDGTRTTVEGATGLDRYRQIFLAAMQSEPISRLVNVQGPAGALQFTESFVPIHGSNGTVVVAQVHSDVTAKDAAMRESAFWSAIGFAIAVGLIFAIPGIALLFRSRQKRVAEAETKTHYDQLQFLAVNMSQGFCQFDADQRLVICNEQYGMIYELSPDVTTPGTPLIDILNDRIVTGSYVGDDPQAYIRERISVVDENEHVRKVHELNNGRVVAVSHKPMPDGGWLTVHDDITEIRRVENQMAHMALHDALTDLPNRVLFRQRIEDAVPLSLRGQAFAVLCLDLDHFKNVNDTLGHPVGDELLKSVADRLRDCTRSVDTVARLGGDEFAIIQTVVNTAETVSTLATRICAELKKPFMLGDHQVLIDVSIGIALAPNDGADADELMKHADLALYKAKGDGRGIFRYFEPELDAKMQERRTLETSLRLAVMESQFELHYQPLVNAETFAITGFEALLRWNHPERGLVSPAEFLPIAEEIGLIVPIGEWVLREACREAASWPGDLRIAVNLSTVQFKNLNLVPTVVSALSVSGLAANRLELEITESALQHDAEMTLQILHMLRKLGVRIAIDDFGTGYSSLSYLRKFPFDKVKIDGSFVRDLGEGNESQAIVQAITGLGSSLGMETTAEGVETEPQVQRIKAEGCSEFQGYYYSPPVPASEIAQRFFDKDNQLLAVSGSK